MPHNYFGPIFAPDPNVALPLTPSHGALMVSLRRTFRVYRDLSSGAILADQLVLLRMLQDLYTRPLPIRSNDNLEESPTGVGIEVDVTHEEANTSVAHEKTRQLNPFALTMSGRHEALFDSSAPIGHAHQKPATDTFAKHTQGSGIGINSSQSASAPHLPAVQPSRK
ncbi:hypothetical protein W97_05107 [Coniosporium apollinis CBS 100218]|uniref:Uncharacterized protein n=1 Tax=Coniosporium apollinis (strain CBS 100218) TaxID=1168221 RepID=R7YVA4_CONA1|nr:uncharacterized protein W97_05107 [Coniosporium apollinis CBS 100218]EON65865.1 hypothetical protein W97_05107 [Coniosporium apollinis CBS 100218]